MTAVFLPGVGILAILTIAWGNVFRTGLRILLPLNVQHLKSDAHYCFLVIIISIVSFCAMIASAAGAIVLLVIIFR